MPKSPLSPIQRVLLHSTVKPGTGCWLCISGIDASGYATISTSEGVKKAHRISYEEFVGPIPDKYHLDHLCRITNCVNPYHLEPVTGAENSRRGSLAITHCINGHEFTPENIRYRPDGRRRCRTCSDAASLAYRNKQQRAPKTPRRELSRAPKRSTSSRPEFPVREG